MTISWIHLPDRIDHELRQLHEEGSDVAAFTRRWEEVKGLGLHGPELLGKAEKFYHELESGPASARKFPDEPSSWDAAARHHPLRPDTVPSYDPGQLENRVLGGWLGRAAGCLLGKPVEKIPRQGIRALLESNGTWPLADYVTESGMDPALRKQHPWNRHYGRESLRENIVCMPEDDDMNYPMLNLHVLEAHGDGFGTADVATTWLDMLPVLQTFTAERVAYLNFLSGIQPPATALFRNPYREWIGAQIRADVWGWVSPAQPSRAAGLAWRDAALSHVRNGIYGEVFFAAAIAASFDHHDARAVVGAALESIPPKSRLAAAVRHILSMPIEGMEWEATVDHLVERYGAYHWVHTINNAALVVAALLSSGNDFGRAICNVVMGGWDTDSNGATVGSIMGTMLGADNIPGQWTGPLNDRVRTSLRGFDNSRFSDLARRTAEFASFLPTNPTH